MWLLLRSCPGCIYNPLQPSVEYVYRQVDIKTVRRVYVLMCFLLLV